MEITSFLMVGQSNMAGRGNIGEVEPIRNPLCHMLRNGCWQPMTEPINPDRPIFEGVYRSGVGLAASFADAYARDTGRDVGLIPCADGGSEIARWQPGELLFDHAVMMTKLAMRTSTVGGILWHQGEQDCSPKRFPYYRERLLSTLRGFRSALGDGFETLPIVIGELYRPAQIVSEDDRYMTAVNEVFHSITEELGHCAVVSSEGLTLKEDGVHFNSASYRTFGVRYYEAFKNIN